MTGSLREDVVGSCGGLFHLSVSKEAVQDATLLGRARLLAEVHCAESSSWDRVYRNDAGCSNLLGLFRPRLGHGSLKNATVVWGSFLKLE